MPLPEEPSLADLRSAPRFVVSSPISGSFGATLIRIIDFSTRGLQVAHDEPLKLGVQARISFAVSASQRVSWRGEVVWSHMAKKPDERGKHPYCSGIRVDEDPVVVEPLLMGMVAGGHAQPERDSLDRKKKALREKARARASQSSMKSVMTAQHDMTTDQLLMINHAWERLQSHPDEAKKWYARAKFSLAEDQTKFLMHYRDDVLAVWEYLERSIDLEKILKIFEGHRK